MITKVFNDIEKRFNENNKQHQKISDVLKRAEDRLEIK
jgi:hypothetical protein